MDPRSVLVSYALNSSRTPFSCSATMISEDWVLAHGTLLEPLLSYSNDSSWNILDELKPGILVANDRSESMEFSVTWATRTNVASNPPCCGAKVVPNVNHDSEESRRKRSYETEKARLVAAWKCPLLGEAFDGILSSWRFSEDPGQRNLAVLDKKLFPLILLLRIQREGSSTSGSSPREALKRLVKRLRAPRRGQEIEIESTPFGNIVFMNSVTNGVVSNVIGLSKPLLLTDASAVIGCEGAPIYVKYKSGYRSMCGIVVAPLSWCRGEWVGYTLGLSLLPCLQRLLDSTDRNNNDLPASVSNSRIVELLDESVVIVGCGSGWGSGVLLDGDSGTFLTCSHVVKEAPASRIRIRGQNFSVRAELVYRTPDNKSYDLAVVRANPREVAATKSLTMVEAPVNKGDEVLCAGFPLIPSSDEPSILPTITRGNVSHVSPGMLQTSCCIQSGTSGGPVVAYPSGQVLGIVVCNATSACNKALFPRVNMAVPAAVFKRPIEEYLRTRDVRCLRALENKDHEIQQTWNLNVTPPSARL